MSPTRKVWDCVLATFPTYVSRPGCRIIHDQFDLRGYITIPANQKGRGIRMQITQPAVARQLATELNAWADAIDTFTKDTPCTTSSTNSPDSSTPPPGHPNPATPTSVNSSPA